jgi:cytochrome c
MFMRKSLAISGFKKLTGLVLILSMVSTVQAAEQSPNLGKPAPQTLEKRWNLDVFPDGTGLPAGSGTAVLGKKVYQQYCLSCHGVDGTGDSAEELAGAKHGLTDTVPDKTIGTYWPYATTIFDFTRRAMPLNAPGILNNDQLYAVTAYLLYLNHLVKENEIINASTLPKVKMPNRNGFINSYQPIK